MDFKQQPAKKDCFIGLISFFGTFLISIVENRVPSVINKHILAVSAVRTVGTQDTKAGFHRAGLPS